ncbi:tat protein [Simian immunodeficiency virus - agm.tan-1]|uniref:Protein Tat n=1 Tax=Simian immunodeficiency virus AGM.tantalus TaxID=349692 RepID=P89907_SIVTA|nr:tat protein [Simian immunodeficiency virus - agm.tan-1]
MESEGDGMAESLLQDLHRPLTPCTNKCFCKRCCYHCQVCFLQKGLGITYHVSRIRRPKKNHSNHQNLVSQQSISAWGGNSQTTQEEKTKIPAAAETSRRPQ